MKKNNSLSLILRLVFAGLFIASGTAFGQSVTTSGLRGTVSDEMGSVISGATVEIVHAPTNSRSVVVTGPSGRFSTGGLRSGGPYTVTIKAPGYQSAAYKDINLSLARESVLSATLKSGDEIIELEEFIVDASQESFNVDVFGPGSVLSTADIADAPTVGESLADLIRLNPLVALGDTDRLEINAVGQHYRQNSIQVDGVNLNDQFGLEATGLPALNNPIALRTIEQITVDVAPYDVRNSGFTGASVNAVTKSGTNNFHGEVYVYYSDDSLRAENPFSGVKEPFDETTYGISIGGPILKDKVFFFLNYEKFTRNQAPDDAGFIPDADSVQQVRDYLMNLSTTAYPNGYDPGTWGSLATAEESDEKWLGKVDWQINDMHRLTVKYSQTEATQPDYGEYTDRGETSLTSHFFTNAYENTAYSAQLNSTWSENFQTDIQIGGDTFDKKPTYINQNLIPQMWIDDFPGADGSTGELFFGSEDSRQANNLAVKTKKFKGVGTYSLEEHTITFGMESEETEFDNLFLQDVYGDIEFNNLAEFLDPTSGIGRNLDRNTGVAGETIAAQSDYTITGFFVQTQWVISENFEMLLGLRNDVVSTDRRPAFNREFSQNFETQDGRTGFNNSNTIDGTSQIAPRIGFRLKLDEETNAVLRGGIGLFQGKVPGVYLSNAFSNNGVTTGRISYDDSITLIDYLNNEFDPQDPILYLDEPSGSNIDLVDPNFELPSIWRTNVAYERDLPWYELRFSVEAVYSRVNKGVWVEDLNLEQVETSPDGRAIYAGTRGNARWDSDYGSVFNLRNNERGDSFNMSFQVERPMVDNWSASLSYVYGESNDVSSVTSSTAFSNYANRAIFNGNEEVVSTSNYEIKHRFIARATYQHDWSERTNTRVSLVYEGRSGRPYSWVFQDDFNNDGIRENDLFYVPSGPNDPNVDFSGNSQAEIDEFFAFINSTSLAAYKGTNPQRNSETSSFIHRFDIKITQEIKITETTKLDLFVNLINVGNMINDDWGITSEVPFSFTRAVVEGEVNGAGLIEYDLGDSPDSERVQSSRSRWQVQVGASFKF